jgi:hypothetical protein
VHTTIIMPGNPHPSGKIWIKDSASSFYSAILPNAPRKGERFI